MQLRRRPDRPRLTRPLAPSPEAALHASGDENPAADLVTRSVKARSEWRDLELVANWTAFLDDPDLYLRYVIE